MEEHSESDIRILISQLHKGSERAFERLYQMHSGMLLANIRSLVKDKEASREILQDLYIKIWECRETIDINKSYKAFLFTVARNLVYDHLRKMALDKRKRFELMASALELYSHVEENITFKETEGLLINAVSHLPEQCRKVYILSKLEGKSHQEISRLLHISLATVNNHMVKANREIRSFLLRHEEISLVVLFSLIPEVLKF